MAKLRRVRVGVVALLLLLLLASVTRAAPAPVPGSIVRAVIASGGAEVQAGDWVLSGTAGQSIAGPVMYDASRGLASGFWQKVTGGGLISLPVVRR
jgi:hypothetical protein